MLDIFDVNFRVPLRDTNRTSEDYEDVFVKPTVVVDVKYQEIHEIDEYTSENVYSNMGWEYLLLTQCQICILGVVFEGCYKLDFVGWQ